MSLKYSTLLSKNGDTYLEVTCSKYKLLIVLQLWIILQRTQCCKYIYEPQTTKKNEPMVLHASWIILMNIFFIFLAFDICRFCVVIRFFLPTTTANDLRLRRISIADLIHYIIILILILEKEPVFSLFNVEC